MVEGKISALHGLWVLSAYPLLSFNKLKMTQVETLYSSQSHLEAFQMLFPGFWGNPCSLDGYACLLGPSVLAYQPCQGTGLVSLSLLEAGSHEVVAAADDIMFASSCYFICTFEGPCKVAITTCFEREQVQGNAASSSYPGAGV